MESGIACAGLTRWGQRLWSCDLPDRLRPDCVPAHRVEREVLGSTLMIRSSENLFFYCYLYYG